MHELHNNVVAMSELAPVAVALANDTAQVSKIVDCQALCAVEFYILTGILADVDATFAVTLTHGDAVDSPTAPTVITDSAAVPADCLIGTLAAAGFTFGDDSTVRRIGYSPARGAGKRYVRLTITPTGNSAAAPLAVLALGLPERVPVAA